MKKLVITLASIFILSFNFANAISSMNTQNVSTNSISMLSSADSNMLFGGEANAIILDNQEMKNTQGEFWGALLVGLFISTVAWLNAPGPNEQIFHGKPPFHW